MACFSALSCEMIFLPSGSFGSSGLSLWISSVMVDTMLVRITGHRRTTVEYEKLLSARTGVESCLFTFAKSRSATVPLYSPVLILGRVALSRGLVELGHGGCGASGWCRKLGEEVVASSHADDADLRTWRRWRFGSADSEAASCRKEGHLSVFLAIVFNETPCMKTPLDERNGQPPQSDAHSASTACRASTAACCMMRAITAG